MILSVQFLFNIKWNEIIQKSTSTVPLSMQWNATNNLFSSLAAQAK